MTVNKIRDLIERVSWTAIQAAAGAALVTGFDDWKLTIEVALVAAVAAALKVIIAQRFSKSGDGSALPGGVT